MDYLEKLGTERYSSEEVSQEFYKLAANLSITSSSDFSYVQVSGLPETFEESVQLLEHLVQHLARLLGNVFQVALLVETYQHIVEEA